MAYLAIDSMGNEDVFQEMPELYSGNWICFDNDMEVRLPSGTIEKILGYKLTLENSPVEIGEVKSHE